MGKTPERDPKWPLNDKRAILRYAKEETWQWQKTSMSEGRDNSFAMLEDWLFIIILVIVDTTAAPALYIVGQ